MAVLSGHFLNINDKLDIQLNAIQYCVSVDSFSYLATNETVNRYFDFYFRYKLNDSTFTTEVWQFLNNTNLTAISVTTSDLLYIELRIIRIGTDNTGDLILNDIILNNTISIVYDTFYPAIFSNPNHIFGYIKVNDLKLNEYYNNIYQKVLKNVMPKFINQTTDLQNLVKTICIYLSLYYIHSKNMNNWYNDKNMLLDILQQKGLYFSGNESLTDLQLISRNTFNEFKKRGTIQVIDELKRLINYDSTNEFIWQFILKNEYGWFLDRTAINYQNLDYVYSINKMVEKYTINSLSNYFLSNDAKVSIIDDVDNNGIAIKALKFTSTQATGINCTSFINDSRMMIINPDFDYEISFKIKQLTPATNYYFGINIYDSSGNLLYCQSLQSSITTNQFNVLPSSIKPTSKYVTIKSILWNKDTILTSDNYKLNISALGSNLKNNEATVYMYPVIKTNDGSDNVCDVRIYDIKVMPLKLSNISISGYLESNRKQFGLLKNNSQNYTDNEIYDIIDRYIINTSSNLTTLIF